MNVRFLASVVVTFMMLWVFGFVIHQLILGPEYASVGLFRTNQADPKHLAVLLLGQAIAATAFVWIYTRGQENKPYLAQGIRYGVAIVALVVVPKYLIYFAVQPMPHMLALKQIVLDSIGILLIAIVVAGLSNPKAKSV